MGDVCICCLFSQMVTRTKKIFVGGLSASTTLDDVKAYFCQFGKVGFVPRRLPVSCSGMEKSGRARSTIPPPPVPPSWDHSIGSMLPYMCHFQSQKSNGESLFTILCCLSGCVPSSATYIIIYLFLGYTYRTSKCGLLYLPIGKDDFVGHFLRPSKWVSA